MDDPLDPIENRLGKPVEEMSPKELMTYIRIYFDEVYGIDLAVDWLRDQAVIKSFQKRYGAQTAGRTIQHVMLHRKGKDHHGKFVTFRSFAQGSKWWTDMQSMEMQERRGKELKKLERQRAREENRQGDTEGRENGFATLTSILRGRDA